MSASNLSPAAYLVDDDRTFCMITRINVNRIDPKLKLKEFSNGAEVLQALEREQPSVMLLDINMSLVNGWEVLDRIEPPQYPVYLISSSIDPEDIRKAEQHPYVKAYLEKPLSAEKLKSILVDIQ